MKLFGIAGWSGSGKTTLLAALVPILIERGLRVSTVKHAGHGFDLDRPGKDSYRHRGAGATEVLIISPERWAMIHELRGETEPPLPELLARMTPVDLVLIEGFKSAPHQKIEVWRKANGKSPLFPDDRQIVAVACDEPPPGCTLPLLPIDDADAVAAFIVAHCGLAGDAAARRRA
ncbi:MAG: molybdopterin-guanine dinucleotide biosynthesis protein B [Rhodospirillaceae bacterium]|nr:molybdopterin-guanine dinucleotide biosynthesis protein B [Rhodospirillaceae bacterium]